MTKFISMYSFKNDYSELAHPAIIEAIMKNNLTQYNGYGEDIWTVKATELIKDLIKNSEAEVHFVSGGTQANALIASAFLKPYEAIIAADTGHILVHEAGAIEATGHKIIAMPHHQGKLKVEDIEAAVHMHTDEHMVLPRLVYLSQSTELGTIYSLAELKNISDVCKKHHLLLYIDGARLGSSMCSYYNDITWSDVAKYADAFYIGGTKNGALFGEAIVITNPNIQANFRFYLKRYGALLAKGAAIGLQFYTLFENDLYQKLAIHANECSAYLAKELETRGISFWMPTQSNQIFPIFTNQMIQKLEKDFGFYTWKSHDESQSVVRLVCSWATEKTALERFLSSIDKSQ